MMSTVTNCDNCGVCCFGQNLLPLSGNIVEERCGGKNYLSPKWQEELERMLNGPMAGDDGCACVWLDRKTGRCIEHYFRPQICRDLEVGDETCLRIRAAHGVV